MTPAALCALNARYGIPGQVAFTTAPGGFPVVEVSNARGAATIALHGGRLMRWAPHGARPVMWLPHVEARVGRPPVHGGVPVCWPWFGRHPGDLSLPKHGLVQDALWEVRATQALGDGATRVVLHITAGSDPISGWPHPSEVTIEVTVGDALELALVTHNRGATPFILGQGLHTYFAVSDARQVAIRGLEDCPYLDAADGGKRKRQSAAVTVRAEINRIYLDAGKECLIDDPGWRRRIRITKRGSGSTVVWNPWREQAAGQAELDDDGYLSMVCVETTNTAHDVVTIAPGDEHHLWVRYALEPLA